MTLSYNDDNIPEHVTYSILYGGKVRTTASSSLEIVFVDPDKEKTRMLFAKRGENRRQDHGSRGNADHIRNLNPRSREADYLSASKRSDYRRGDTPEME